MIHSQRHRTQTDREHLHKDALVWYFLPRVLYPLIVAELDRVLALHNLRGEGVVAELHHLEGHLQSQRDLSSASMYIQSRCIIFRVTSFLLYFERYPDASQIACIQTHTIYHNVIHSSTASVSF